MRLFVLFSLLLLPPSLSAQKPSAAECQSCAVNKKMIRCDYYVARKAVKEKQGECEIYARYLDRDGTRARAAWYYLLAGRPAEALTAARQAMDAGHDYAVEYAIFALWILKKDSKAERLLKEHADLLRSVGYFEEDRRILAKLYPKSALSGKAAAPLSDRSSNR